MQFTTVVLAILAAVPALALPQGGAMSAASSFAIPSGRPSGRPGRPSGGFPSDFSLPTAFPTGFPEPTGPRPSHAHHSFGGSGFPRPTGSFSRHSHAPRPTASPVASASAI